MKKLTREELKWIIVQEKKHFVCGRAVTLIQDVAGDDMYPVTADMIDSFMNYVKQARGIGKKTHVYLESVLRRELC